MERERIETLVDRVVADVERVGDLLVELAAAMERCRTAYVSLRPSELEAAIGPMLEIEARLREAAAAREPRLVRLRAALGGAGPVTLSEIERAASPRLAGRVREVRERLAEAVARVRVEAAVGGRLLELAGTAFDEMVRSLVGEEAGGAHAYDRRARVVSRPARGQGAFVTGTL